jgi:amino acid transporter
MSHAQFDYASPQNPHHGNGGLMDGNGAYDSKKESRASFAGSATEHANADELLNVLGYQSELVRSRSTFQVAFMSFVLASVPYGLATTLLYPIAGGGPVAVIWGWCGVCAIIGCLAVSLGEITSVYPTAGGVYYQTFMLSPPRWRRITAWICGWAYALGNIIITLSVNFGTTLFFIGCINIFQDGEGNGIWAPETYQYYLVFLAITLVCNLITSLGNRILPWLDVSSAPKRHDLVN